jgi:hypothetical protein
MKTIYILFIVFAALFILVVIPAFVIPITIINQRDKNRFQELQKNGQVTSIRYKVKKIILWTECGETYAYDTYVRTLGDTQIIHTTNEMEDEFNIPTSIIKIEFCDLTTVRLICMSETGEIFKQSISNKNATHLELAFENGKTTVLF